MKNVKLTQKDLRKRKMLLVLPLLVIPFLTMGFYALGGGGKQVEPSNTATEGLNAKLPDANLKTDELQDKLSFYNKADKDSAQMEEWMRRDPYYKDAETTEPLTGELESIGEASASKYNQRLNVSPYEGGGRKPEDEVMQKLSRLQKELNNNTTMQRPTTDPYDQYQSPTNLSGDVERLEGMMDRMNGNQEGEDPEIAQLSSVMDKILDVQHPDRVKDRLQQQYKSAAVPALGVSATPEKDSTTGGFYSLRPNEQKAETNAIKAVVNENQVLVDGSVIKLRLLQDIYVAGKKVPMGTFIFGYASLNGERLGIGINSIRYGSSVYTIKMHVYDMDGLAGIHIPGAITREVAKQSADNSLQLMQLSSMDPSLKAQAASAGINTAKSLLSRKVKLVKVTVKAGYKVLLVDESNN